MLTDQDIKKLTAAQKKVFATKTDLRGMEKRTKAEIGTLESRMVTKTDLVALKVDLVEVKDQMATKQDFTELKSSFSDLQMSVDRYLKFTEAWHQELTILKGRQDRLSQVLVNKGIVSEKEIALLG